MAGRSFLSILLALVAALFLLSVAQAQTDALPTSCGSVQSMVNGECGCAAAADRLPPALCSALFLRSCCAFLLLSCAAACRPLYSIQ